jgi:hypothetical protein
MNRLLKHIILIAVCFTVMAAPTCESESSHADNRQSRIYRLEAVSEEFIAESLSDRNLEAFEFKAVEKLMDYADYLGIIYSERYAASFQRQARQNIISYFDTRENAETALHPGVISGSHDSYVFRVDSVEIINPLQRETDTRYTGRMEYVETIQGSDPADTSLISHSRKTIEIILQMDYKNFGEQSLLVWNVLLGRISPAD